MSLGRKEKLQLKNKVAEGVYSGSTARTDEITVGTGRGELRTRSFFHETAERAAWWQQMFVQCGEKTVKAGSERCGGG